jgi:penicillin-binding protein 2
VLAISLLLASAISLSPNLERSVNEAMNKRQGAAVVLDVQTGRILASYRMDVAARRAVSPGSAIKPFTLMTLIEAGVVTEQTALICPKVVRIGKRTFDCSHEVLPGPLNAVAALAYSCNHFFTRLAETLPLDALTRAFSRFGFSSLTGKWQTEIPGTVQQPVSKQALQLMSIGADDIAVTPLAMAEAYCQLARRLRSQENTAEMRIISEGLRAVVTTGTGKLAASKQVVVSGKTGTAGGHGWFAGFVPSERPEIVVVVFLERGTGPADAALIAGRILDSYVPGEQR